MAKKIEEILKICEDYENKCRKEGLLEVDLTSIKFNTDSLIKFLVSFFYWNHIAALDGKSTFTQTQVIGSTGRQCYCGARRSIGDLWKLAAHYYSDSIKMTDVMLAIMEICNSGTPIKLEEGRNTGYMYTNICSTIHRRVFNSSGKVASSSYFNTSNGSYSYGSDRSYDEFTIVMEDYITLKKWVDSAEQRKLAEEKAAKEAELRKQKLQEDLLKKQLASKSLDDLVAEKLASIINTEPTLVKKTRKKKAA